MTKMRLLIRLTDSKYFTVFFVILTAFVYLFGLTVPLMGPDEPRYAQVAREMYERGDLITPTLGGFTWFEKPALLYWLQIFSYSIFGVNEFAARFGSAILGLGTIGCLWFIARSAISPKECQNGAGKHFANLAGLVAASTLGLIVFSRGASFDIVLTFPVSASLAAFFIYFRSEKSGNGKPLAPLAAFYAFTGLGLLAKGLVGAIFPFAVIGCFFLLRGKFPAKSFFISLIWGVGIILVVACSWYLPVYLRHGYDFVEEFFIQHHFQRYTSNKFQHPQPFYFFFWVLPLMTIPWLPFFFAAFWKYGRSFIRRWAERPLQKDDTLLSSERSSSPNGILRGGNAVQGTSLNDLALFSISWLLVPLIFFSFSGSKLPAYILPSVPGAVLLTSVFLYEKFAHSDVWRFFVRSIAVTTLFVVSLLVHFALPSFANDDSVKMLIAEADRTGFSKSRVIGFIGVSHNAEFYAAGRLFRTSDGKQRKLDGPSDIAMLIKEEGGAPLLILIRHEHLHFIEAERSIRTSIIAQNGEFALVSAALP